LEQLRDMPGESEALLEEPFLDFDGDCAAVQPKGTINSRSGKIVLKRFGGWRSRYQQWRDEISRKLDGVDLAPDLAEDIGSPRWFRGLGTMLGLGAVALALWPDFAPLEARPAMTMNQSVRDEFRSHMITPLALGGDSGRQMGAGRQVKPLASAPERPQIELVATLARGDSFDRMLQRAGLGSADAQRVHELVASEIPLAEIEPGTRIDITLGRRPREGAPRPLDALAFRARFDLQLEVQKPVAAPQGDPGRRHAAADSRHRGAEPLPIGACRRGTSGRGAGFHQGARWPDRPQSKRSLNRRV